MLAGDATSAQVASSILRQSTEQHTCVETFISQKVLETGSRIFYVAELWWWAEIFSIIKQKTIWKVLHRKHWDWKSTKLDQMSVRPDSTWIDNCGLEFKPLNQKILKIYLPLFSTPIHLHITRNSMFNDCTKWCSLFSPTYPLGYLQHWNYATLITNECSFTTEYSIIFIQSMLAVTE